MSQKTDRQDAELIFRLLLEDRFPRVWVPNGENRDLRQLLWHRHRMVQARMRIKDYERALIGMAKAKPSTRVKWRSSECTG